MRIIREKPTNNLPKEIRDLAQLSRLMSYIGNDPENLANTFLIDYEKHTLQMREYYRETIGQLLRTGPRSSSAEENDNRPIDTFN